MRPVKSPANGVRGGPRDFDVSVGDCILRFTYNSKLYVYRFFVQEFVFSTCESVEFWLAPSEAHEFRTYLKYWSCGYPALMISMKSTAGETANATLHLGRGNREIGLTFACFLPGRYLVFTNFL